MSLDWHQITQDIYEVRYGMLFGVFGGFLGTALMIPLSEVNYLSKILVGIMLGSTFAFIAESFRRVILPDLKDRYTKEDDRK